MAIYNTLLALLCNPEHYNQHGVTTNGFNSVTTFNN